MIVLLMSSLVTFLYARPLGLKNLVIHDQNLREVSGLKIFIIAAVWTSMTVLIPFIDIQISFDQFGWIYLTQRYIFIMALVLPFDIRDTIYDQIRLATIPQILGLIGTKIVGVFGTMIVVFLTFYIDIDIIPNVDRLFIIDAFNPFEQCETTVLLHGFLGRGNSINLVEFFIIKQVRLILRALRVVQFLEICL